MRKIKILQIINGLGIGGAEKVVFDICETFPSLLTL